MNKSGHQVLTIKAIHYPTMPWDCICEILLGVKNGRGKKRKGRKSWTGFPMKYTNNVSLDSRTLRVQLSYGSTALSQKLARASLAKGIFNCKSESRGEKKKKTKQPVHCITPEDTGSCGAALPVLRTLACLHIHLFAASLLS